MIFLKPFKRLALAFLLTILSLLLLISGAFVYLVVTPSGGHRLVDYALKQFAAVAIIQVGQYEGSIHEGFILRDVTIKGLPYLPHALGRIQQIRVQIPLLDFVHTSLSILNARIFVPQCDPIVFSGTFLNGQLQGNLYAKQVDINSISHFWVSPFIRKHLQGSISDVDLVITGTVSKPTLAGRLYVDKISYRHTVVSEGFGRVSLTLSGSVGNPSMIGHAILDSGKVMTPRISVDLIPSRVNFIGDMANPVLDIHGETRVDDLDISMTIKGTLIKPELVLSSDPPLPSDVVLMVLATGKGWSGLSNPFGKEDLSTALVGDFMDYFLLGGSGRSLGRDYGPSNFITPYDDQVKKIGLKKKLTEDLKVGLDVEQLPTQFGGARVYSRKVEGEMSVSDHVSVNVSQKVLPEDRSSSKDVQRIRQGGETQVYLKYKENF